MIYEITADSLLFLGTKGSAVKTMLELCVGSAMVVDWYSFCKVSTENLQHATQVGDFKNTVEIYGSKKQNNRWLKCWQVKKKNCPCHEGIQRE
jgi:hypothetical protein